LGEFGTDSVVPGISDMIASIRQANRSMVRNDPIPGASGGTAPGSPSAAPAPVTLPQFRNF
jgi:hypothetical protein